MSMTRPTGSWNGNEKRAVQEGGKRLRKYREKIPMTMIELAQKADVGPGALRDIEDGRRTLTSAEGHRIAQAFGIAWQQLNGLVGYEACDRPKLRAIRPEPIAGPDECPEQLQALEKIRADKLDHRPSPILDSETSPAMSKDQPAPPAGNMPSFDLNQFFGAYQKMQMDMLELERVINKHALPGLDLAKPPLERAMRLLDMQAQRIDQLARIAQDAKTQTDGLKTLKALQQFLSDEISKIEGA